MNVLTVLAFTLAWALIGATSPTAALAAPPVPTFSLDDVADLKDKVKITWSATTNYVSIKRHRLGADGKPVYGTLHVWKQVLNDGEMIDDPDPPGAASATFEYAIRAKQGSTYSPWSAWKKIHNIH